MKHIKSFMKKYWVNIGILICWAICIGLLIKDGTDFVTIIALTALTAAQMYIAYKY